ncbi:MULTISPECIES: DUF892 family protein [unclassified Mesorhizobium]|uniref:YciE/YciF ferroxidase family protein n=1 Tax=unclassified Mesorhizobium TaxID=325217 RepID=UPI001CD061EF|nr:MULTISPECIES: DUF892 family protein [unclassified Mesorhizobium]MCA0027130.1 DUF892 family protein [Mesorhizobium sp. B263B1A]
MTQSRDWLIQWLRDAHAMEEQAETMLSGQLSRLESYPELRNHIRQHLDETRQQASRLKSCLDRIGEGSSAMKDAGGKLTAMAQSISGVFAGDEVMKGSLASYTFEQSARRGGDGGIGSRAISPRRRRCSCLAPRPTAMPRNGDAQMARADFFSGDRVRWAALAPAAGS